MRYGIPQSTLPIDSSGKFCGADFAACFQQRFIQPRCEQQDVKAKLNAESKTRNIANVEWTAVVRENDVLLGKGMDTSHAGNARLSEIVQGKLSDYYGASKFEKTCISIAIVDMIKESGGRFLKRRAKGVNEWVEAGDLESRRSVIHRFRNRLSTPHQET